MDADNTKALNDAVWTKNQSVTDFDIAHIGAAEKLRENSWISPDKHRDENLAPAVTVYLPPDDSHSFIRDVVRTKTIPFVKSDDKELGVRFGGHDNIPDKNANIGVHHSQKAGLYFKWNF